jgi:hypothetical protein
MFPRPVSMSFGQRPAVTDDGSQRLCSRLLAFRALAPPLDVRRRTVGERDQRHGHSSEREPQVQLEVRRLKRSADADDKRYL